MTTRRHPRFARPWRHAAGALLAAALLLPFAARADRAAFTNAEGTMVAAHWLPAPTAGEPRPAVIGLHGCGGLYRRDGTTLDSRYTDYAARLHAAGIHLLLPDSFGSRGAGSICAVRRGERTISAATRRADVLAAVAWLRELPEVDPKRIVLLGWSHGASTLLATVNSARPQHAQVAGAIAFYPGCTAALKQPFALDAPLLMLLGADDDWTPPASCERLVARALDARPPADIELKVYPASVHGFDSRAPVRLRSDVPNGVDPAGVHVGGNPQARAAALGEMDRFLARILQ